MVPAPGRAARGINRKAVPPPGVPAPELSSLATALEELSRRVTAIAEGLANTPSD